LQCQRCGHAWISRSPDAVRLHENAQQHAQHRPPKG
jgi:hypothetical protein